MSIIDQFAKYAPIGILIIGVITLIINLWGKKSKIKADSKVLANNKELMSESELKGILNSLIGTDSISLDNVKKIETLLSRRNEAEFKYNHRCLEKKRKYFLQSLKEMIDYAAPELFIHTRNIKTKYLFLRPDWNPEINQLSTPKQNKKYTDIRYELNQLVQKVEKNYNLYRKKIKKTLKE